MTSSLRRHETNNTVTYIRINFKQPTKCSFNPHTNTRTAGRYAPFLLGCPLSYPSTYSVSFILWQRSSPYMFRPPSNTFHSIVEVFKAFQKENPRHSRSSKKVPARQFMSQSEFHKLTDMDSKMDRRRKGNISLCTVQKDRFNYNLGFRIVRWIFYFSQKKKGMDIGQTYNTNIYTI